MTTEMVKLPDNPRLAEYKYRKLDHRTLELATLDDEITLTITNAGSMVGIDPPPLGQQCCRGEQFTVALDVEPQVTDYYHVVIQEVIPLFSPRGALNDRMKLIYDLLKVNWISKNPGCRKYNLTIHCLLEEGTKVTTEFTQPVDFLYHPELFDPKISSQGAL